MRFKAELFRQFSLGIRQGKELALASGFLLAMPGLWQGLETPAFDALIALSLFNVGGFVVAALVSALRGLSRIKRLRLALLLPSLPVYYLLMSFATWQALGQLFRTPSRWEKTAHGISKARRTPGASADVHCPGDGCAAG